MKTKEEILEDCFGELGDPERELTSKPYRAVLEAMDEWANQQAAQSKGWTDGMDYQSSPSRKDLNWELYIKQLKEP